MIFLKIDPDDVIRCVSNEMKVSIDDIKGPSRRMRIVTARHTAIYLSKKYSNYSLRQLSERFNRGHHSTLVNACSNVDAWITYSKHFRQVFEGVEARLRGLYVDQKKRYCERN